MSAGIQSVISFVKETTWGTAVTPNKSIAVRPEGGITTKVDTQLIPAVKGLLAKNYNAIKGKTEHGGDFSFDLFADYVGHFLLSAHGSDSAATHSGESIVYDHTFSDSVTKPSYTIEQAIGENIRRYAGSIVSGYKIEGKPGEMIMFSPTIMAKTQASASAIAPAFTTVPAFNFAQAAVKIGGSTIGEVESIEIEYKNGLEMVYGLGSNEPLYYSINGGAEVSVKIDLYLDSTSLTRFSNYLALTNEAIELILTGGSIGSAANYMLDYLIPKAYYTSGETKINDAHNLLSVQADGIYDTATSTLVKPILTNLVASY